MTEDKEYVLRKTSDSDCSEVSMTDTYFSEDEIVCCFVDGSSQSSDSDQTMNERTDAFPVWSLNSTEKREIIERQRNNAKENLIIHPKNGKNYISKRYPDLLQSLQTLDKHGATLIYLSSSVLSDIQSVNLNQLPASLIGDVCIFSPANPVKLLSLVTLDVKPREVYKYNSKAARALSQLLCDESSNDISIVSGVVNHDDWQVSEKFLETVKDWEKIARKVEIPDSLDMNCIRHLEIVNSFFSVVSQKELSIGHQEMKRKIEFPEEEDSLRKKSREKKIVPQMQLSRIDGTDHSLIYLRNGGLTNGMI